MMQDVAERLNSCAGCSKGGDPKRQGIADYDLVDEDEVSGRGTGHYCSRACMAVLAACLAYIVGSAFLPLPQPWERWFEFPGVRPTHDVRMVLTDTNKDSGMDYDCSIGLTAWTLIWSLTQKAWCCRYKNQGCPPDDNYDCQEGLNSMDIWPQGKQDFCCGYDGEGCMELQSKPAGHDCTYELEEWETAWSPMKKKLCCEKHNFRCDAVPEIPDMCTKACHFGGVDATCQERIDWLTGHPKPQGLKGELKACERAHEMVVRDCDVCSPCDLAAAGCI